MNWTGSRTGVAVSCAKRFEMNHQEHEEHEEAELAGRLGALGVLGGEFDCACGAHSLAVELMT
jgi:hypothetical protein